MDAELLARIHFAVTIGFHYLFPPVSIGMSWLICYFLWKFYKTGDTDYDKIGAFWIKIFGVTFAVGVATGILMEFQFGMNWADYSRFVGDIFGAPLAAEAIFAFFLESSFLAVLIYGKKLVSRKVYWISSLMVTIGSTMSGFWIIVANSWQQTPAGYHIVNGRAELTDFFAAVFNPSTLPRYFHTITAALVTGSFFIAGISAFFILTKRNTRLAQKSLSTALVAALISSLLTLFVGHWHTIQVEATQPAKFAAIEGIWESTKNPPLLLFGVPDQEKEMNHFEFGLPGVINIMLGKDSDYVVKGLKEFPKDERPNVAIVMTTFHMMAGSGTFLILIAIVGMFLMFKGILFKSNWYLWNLVFTIPTPFIMNEIGWMTAEIGRQPWVVYNVLKTSDAFSKSVDAASILFSLILFSGIYLLLFFVWVFVIITIIKAGFEKETLEV